MSLLDVNFKLHGSIKKRQMPDMDLKRQQTKQKNESYRYTCMIYFHFIVKYDIMYQFDIAIHS